MSAVKNEIDVILPESLENDETEAGVELALYWAHYRYIARYGWCRKCKEFIGAEEVGFFTHLPVFSGCERLFEIAETIGCYYWGFSRKYYEAVSFHVLQSFAHRLVSFKGYASGTTYAPHVRSIPVGRNSTTESGFELQDGRVIVWFVKYGVGRFSLDLNDISESTARSFNFFGRPHEYGREGEKAMLKSLGIYPIATVAENRCLATCDLLDGCHQSGVHELDQIDELQARWKLNDKDVLPTKLIKVNLVEFPQSDL